MAADKSFNIGVNFEQHGAADAEKELQRVADATKALGKENVDVATFTKDAMDPALAHLKETTKESAAEAEKHAAQSKELNKVFRQIDEVLPGMGEALKAAFHPSIFSASVALIGGIVGGIALYRDRVEEISKALGAIELPDITESYVMRVTQGAEAWGKYYESIQNGSKNILSIDKQSDRRIEQINKEYDALKKLLEARKAGELADLEANKGSIGEVEFEKRKRGIESRYAGAGIAAEEAKGADVLSEKEQRRRQLLVENQRLLEEAAKIKIADAETDERNLETLRKQKEVAEADIEERKKWIEKIDSGSTDTVQALMNLPGYHLRYGGQTPGYEAIALEKSQIASQQAIVDRANRAEAAKKARDEERARREELLNQAASSKTEAEQLAVDLYGTSDQFGRTVIPGSAGDPARTARAARRNAVLSGGEAAAKNIYQEGFAAVDAQSHGAKLSEQQQQQLQAFRELFNNLGSNGDKVIQAIQESRNVILQQQRDIEWLHRQFQQLESRLNTSVRQP